MLCVSVWHLFACAGDDNVAIHANGTLIENCRMGTGHGVSIGSISDAYVSNVTVRSCSFENTTAGCRIKTDPGAKGAVWDVTYTNLTMQNGACAAGVVAAVCTR